jgi:uncharacterized repeat protein (TIGR03803 family)
LVLSGSNLYGVAVGASAGYEVFSVPVTGGTPSVLATLSVAPFDAAPEFVGVVLSGNTLYGTITSGGAGWGEIFSLPLTGGTPTVLASFDYADGYLPEANLTVVGNTLYGTTTGGGQYDGGEIFSLPITGGTPTVLASFNGADGDAPAAPLITDGAGNFYGTTVDGGSGYGNVFELSPVIAVPEPASLAVLAAGALLLSARRSRKCPSRRQA